MIKIIISLISIIISTAYIIGFIRDAALLEQFGFSHFELIGNSLEYFAIGGMYLIFNFSKHLFWIVIVFSVVGVVYVPIKRKISPECLNKYIDTESVPYVLLGLLSVCFIAITPVVNDAQKLANQYKNMEPKELICTKTEKTCKKGNIIMFRASKVIFLTYKENKKNVVINIVPDGEVISITQLIS